MTATTRIPLASCWFCQDCQCFVDSAVQCECGSSALMCMGTILNRPPWPQLSARELESICDDLVTTLNAPLEFRRRR